MNQLVIINASLQKMTCYENGHMVAMYLVSTGKNGLGEKKDSGCTPRGWHKIYSIIGKNKAINSVFVSREWTGEIYSLKLAQEFPGRDWILTRIIQIDGLDFNRNKGNDVDSLERYIYIHGTPDETELGKPGSKGCVRMRNLDIIELTNWLLDNTLIYIKN